MNNLATNLRSLIDSQGISENELAERTGVPQPTINRILRGESRDPRDKTVLPLADYFGVSLEEMKRGLGQSGINSRPASLESSVLDSDQSGVIIVRHAAGFDYAPGPAQMAFPKALLPQELLELQAAGHLGWILNPTDSMGTQIPKGVVTFIDRSYKTVRGNGTYALRLFREPTIMRVQVRGQGELRVTGVNQYDDSIDLHGERIDSLEVAGLVVGYADRVRLIGGSS